MSNTDEERANEIITKTTELLIDELQPQAILLFGSRAKGNARSGSDFDFAVSGSKPPESKIDQLENQMESFLGLYTADLVFLDDIDDNFRQLILKTGKVLYEQK